MTQKAPFAATEAQASLHRELVEIINKRMPEMGALQIMCVTAELTGRLMRFCVVGRISQCVVRSSISTNMALGSQAADMDMAIPDGATIAPGSEAVN